MPPMGLTFADMQAMRTIGSSALYPEMKNMKYMQPPDKDELEFAKAGSEYYERIRLSPYNLPQEAEAQTSGNEVERYSDKYKVKPDLVSNQDHLSTLKSIMNPEFFPQQVFDGVKKRKVTQKKERRKIDWDNADENVDEENEDELEEEEEQDDGEDDADYANQYFDNGEGDDDDGGDDDGGGGDFE